MSAIITVESRIITAKNFIEENFNSQNTITHFYIGKSIPWDVENSPDVANSSIKNNIDTLKYRIFMKKISKDNTILSIKRFNWTNGTIYTRADSDIDYTDYRTWIHPESPFYVINSEENVYKCINNNNNSPSTNEPLGQGTGYIYTGDGYIWKFMFNIKQEIKDKFLTNNWIPVPYEDNDKDIPQINVENSAVPGDIPFIRVDSHGTNYTNTPDIVIRGDGNGATAIAVMNGETINHIKVVNPGSGYTWATVHIFGNGNNASASAMISPLKGHGSDAVYELGAFFILMTQTIEGSEDGIAPISGTYRNVGAVRNTKDISGNILTSEKFNTLSDINITNASGNFQENELLIGEDSHARCIVYNDPGGTNKTIQVYVIDGTFIDNEYIHGQTTSEVGNYNESSSNITNIDIYSGELLYKENIIFIHRKEIQTEKFVFTIEF